MITNLPGTDTRSIQPTRAYTLPQLADVLRGDAQKRGRVGVRSLRRAIHAGRLKALRLNGRGDIRVMGSWALEYLETLVVGR